MNENLFLNLFYSWFLVFILTRNISFKKSYLNKEGFLKYKKLRLSDPDIFNQNLIKLYSSIILKKILQLKFPLH